MLGARRGRGRDRGDRGGRAGSGSGPAAPAHEPPRYASGRLSPETAVTCTLPDGTLVEGVRGSGLRRMPAGWVVVDYKTDREHAALGEDRCPPAGGDLCVGDRAGHPDASSAQRAADLRAATVAPSTAPSTRPPAPQHPLGPPAATTLRLRGPARVLAAHPTLLRRYLEDPRHDRHRRARYRSRCRRETSLARHTTARPSVQRPQTGWLILHRLQRNPSLRPLASRPGSGFLLYGNRCGHLL